MEYFEKNPQYVKMTMIMDHRINLLNNSLILLFLFFGKWLFAQGYQLPDRNIIPPTPTPYQLGLYGSHPISYYRGTTAIEIPIYSLTIDDFQLPLSLTYNSSGIKVDDIASWVGLGWSLNAGGVISVSTKGAPDFHGNRLRIRSTSEIENKNIPTVDSLQWIYSGPYIDSEPDIYNYNFCGYSGQFVIDNDFNVRFTKACDGLSIIANQNEVSFTAKDLYGRTYYFESNHVEKSSRGKRFWGYAYNSSSNYTLPLTNNFSDDSFHDVPTAFFLSKIELESNKGTILFEYENDTVKFLSKLAGQIQTERYSNLNTCSDISNPPFNWDEGQNSYAFQQFAYTNITKRLTRIFYERDNVEVVFHALNERLDLKNSNRLDKIELKRNSQTLMIWKLSYDYFESLVQKQEFYTNNNLHHRLKLSEVQKFDKDEIPAEPPFKFTYYGDNGSPQSNINMPYRTSFDGYDHWGYCNKSVSFEESEKPSLLFPHLTFQDLQETKFIALHHTNEFYPVQNPILDFSIYYTVLPPFLQTHGNRSPSEDWMKTHTLFLIEYPTGGTTKFYYEAHRYNNYSDTAGGLRIKQIITEDDLGNIASNREYSYSSGIFEHKPSYLKVLFRNYYICDNGNMQWNGNYFLGAGHAGQQGPITPAGYVLSTTSNSLVHTLNTDYISYQQVTEKRLSDSELQTLDYIYNSFNSTINYDYSFCYYSGEAYGIKRSGYIGGQYVPVYPFVAGNTAPSYKRGLLDKVVYKNSDNNIVRKDKHSYDFYNEDIIYGNEVHREHPSAQEFYFISAYKLYTGKSLLTSLVTETFDANGQNPLATEYSYSYNVDQELKAEIEEIQSDDRRLVTKIYYPFNYTSSYSNVLAIMVNRKMIDYPIETIKSVNGQVTDAAFNKYSFFGQIIKPAEVFKIEITEPLNDFIPSYQLTFGQIDTRYKKQSEFYYSPDFGNLLDTRLTSNFTSTYIWGYNYTLPIAKIENATFEEASSELNAMGYSIESLQNKTDTQLRTIFSLLRNRTAMQNTLISSYTYRPLLGISSETNPAGITTFYEYDSFNRLHYIRNNEIEYLKKFDYHYKDQ